MICVGSKCGGWILVGMKVLTRTIQKHGRQMNIYTVQESGTGQSDCLQNSFPS